MSSCAKDVPDQEHTVTSDQISTSIPKSEIPNNYIDGETVPEILAEVDKAIKPAELEHRTSDKLPFKVLGYDKSRALKVYNDSFEITSYAFLAYTDLTDINKVVNIVVTQKKNGKPGKPYLYEYTYKPVQNRPHPQLTKIVKYKFNGVKIDLPGANFDPCIDVICDKYTLPAGSGGTGTGSSGGGGGGNYYSGGTYGSTSSGDLIYTGGGGAGTVICTKTSVTFIAVQGGTVVIDQYSCPGGYSVTLVRFRSSQYLSGCCDAVSVDIGVVGASAMSLAYSKHETLKNTYLDYRVDINSVLKQHGAEKYLAAATLYESSKQEGMWPVLDKESATFYLELFKSQIAPLGVQFLPYGIGDAADILLSCKGGLSWDCSLAVVGVLVPADELYAIYKNSGFIKAIWKTIANASELIDAWRFLKHCPEVIRTKPEILEGMKIALKRGFQPATNLANYASSIRASFIDINTINHIFRGSNNGGVHHISALMADPSTYKIHNRVETANGCYKATVYKNGVPMTPDKDFFPDDWDELKIITEIKWAWGNKSFRSDLSFNSWVGTASNGQKIQMYISNNKIVSAFPYHGN
jgi:hypothetical protein